MLACPFISSPCQAFGSMRRLSWTSLGLDIDDQGNLAHNSSEEAQRRSGSGQDHNAKLSQLPGSGNSSTHGAWHAGLAAASPPSHQPASCPEHCSAHAFGQADMASTLSFSRQPASFPGNFPPLHQARREEANPASHSLPTTPKQRRRFVTASDHTAPNASPTESPTPSFEALQSTQLTRATNLEKNRQAQARFRDKQRRKEQDMQTRIMELEQQLQAMQLQSNNAKRENQVLNKVLELRETHIEVLKETSKLPDSPTAPLGQLTPTPPPPPSPAAASSHGPPAPTLEQLRTMTTRDAARLWCDYLQSMALLLLSVETLNPEPAAVARLEAVTQAARRFLQTLGVINPAVWAATMRMNLELMQPFAADAFQAEAFCKPFWADKAAALALSPEQREQVVLVGRQHLDSIVRLDAEALPIKRELEALLPHCTIDVEDACLSSSSHAHALVHRWNKIYLKKQASWFTFTSTILLKVLTPMQMARFSVDSYPHAPLPNGILASIMPPSQTATAASETVSSAAAVTAAPSQ